jgi:hypothetical protein
MAPMMPNVLLALNQQFQQGCACAQQGMFAEQTGNWPIAAQCYDQSIAIIGNAIAVAGQYGVPVLDNVFASLAVCHFQAARAKSVTGWVQFVPTHLAAASQAINQAIALRPDVGQYQAAAAMLQAAQASFSSPQNPLPTVQFAQTSYSAPQNPLQTVQFAQPSPQPASSDNGKASQKQWVELLTSGLNVLNTVCGMAQQTNQNGGDASQWNQGAGWTQSGWS